MKYDLRRERNFKVQTKQDFNQQRAMANNWKIL